MTRPPRTHTRTKWARRLPTPRPLPDWGILDAAAITLIVAVILCGLRDPLPDTSWARVSGIGLTLGTGWALLLTRLGFSTDWTVNTLPLAYLATAPMVVFGACTPRTLLDTITQTLSGWEYFVSTDDTSLTATHGGLLIVYLLGVLFTGYLSAITLGATNPHRPVIGLLVLGAVVAALTESTPAHTTAWILTAFVLTTGWYAHRRIRHDHTVLTTRHLRTRTAISALTLATLASLGAVALTPHLIAPKGVTPEPQAAPQPQASTHGTPTLILDGDWAVTDSPNPGTHPARKAPSTPRQPGSTAAPHNSTPRPDRDGTQPARRDQPTKPGDTASTNPDDRTNRTGVGTPPATGEQTPTTGTGETATKDANVTPPSPVDPHKAAPAAKSPQPVNRSVRRMVTATIALLVGLLVVVCAAVVTLKTARTYRRRTHGTTLERIHGSWQELLDLARDLGHPAPVHATRPEQARQLNLPRTTALAIDAATFGPHPPHDATTHWADLATHKRTIRRQAHWLRKLAAPFNPASLRSRHRPRGSRSFVQPIPTTATLDPTPGRPVRPTKPSSQRKRFTMTQVPVEVLRCPTHGIPDCSPLLNGCTQPSQQAAAWLTTQETDEK